MSDQSAPYHIVDLSPARRLMINMLDLSESKQSMYGLLEVDVTVVRQFIAEHKARTGETLSFTGFLTLCLARAVDEDKSVQAYLKGRKQLVLFDDVDVGLMIEGKIGDKRALMGHVIRGANRKTYLEIHQEIRSVQSKPVPPSRGMPSWFRSAMLLPWPLSQLVQALHPNGRAPRPDDCYVHGRHGWHHCGRYVWRGPQRLGGFPPNPGARPGCGQYCLEARPLWKAGSSRARSST